MSSNPSPKIAKPALVGGTIVGLHLLWIVGHLVAGRFFGVLTGVPGWAWPLGFAVLLLHLLRVWLGPDCRKTIGFVRPGWNRCALFAAGTLAITAWIALAPTRWEHVGGRAALRAFAFALSEEVVYRGVVLTVLLSRVSATRAVLLSSLLFAAVHVVNLVGGEPGEIVALRVTYTFGIGAVLGAARIGSGSLALPILLHMAWNLAVNASAIDAGPPDYLKAGLVSGGLACAAFASIGMRVGVSRSQIVLLGCWCASLACIVLPADGRDDVTGVDEQATAQAEQSLMTSQTVESLASVALDSRVAESVRLQATNRLGELVDERVPGWLRSGEKRGAILHLGESLTALSADLGERGAAAGFSLFILVENVCEVDRELGIELVSRLVDALPSANEEQSRTIAQSILEEPAFITPFIHKLAPMLDASEKHVRTAAAVVLAPACPPELREKTEHRLMIARDEHGRDDMIAVIDDALAALRK